MAASKLSISLDTPLLDFLTQHQEREGLRTRSEVVAQALLLLRDRDLEQQYAHAVAEWQQSDDVQLWDPIAGDGL